ncbi:MAG: GAF domain-containing protein [Polyangia bacterium]
MTTTPPSPSAPPKQAETPALAEHKREFIETFFKRGAELTEELIRENERLRQRVVELEASTRGGSEAPHDYAARLLEIERENNNLANLFVASQALHSAVELGELASVLVEILLNFVGAKTFAIQLVDEERGILRTLVSEGVERSDVPQPSIGNAALVGPMRGEALLPTGPLRARPVTAAPMVCVPLKLGEKIVGIIAVWELLLQKTELADVDFELFKLLGDHAGSALQSARLGAELKGRPLALWGAVDLV